jgi:hypothetical protein
LTDPETIALRITVIGGKRWPDDFTVIWRELADRQDHARARPAASPSAMAMDLQFLQQTRRWRRRIR